MRRKIVQVIREFSSKMRVLCSDGTIWQGSFVEEATDTDSAHYSWDNFIWKQVPIPELPVQRSLLKRLLFLKEDK